MNNRTTTMRPLGAAAPPILTDVVSQVVASLPRSLQRRFITNHIMTETRVALRLITTKVGSTGSLGRQDRPETRAAVLLDYVIRKNSNNNNHSSSAADSTTTTTTIDLKHLAAVNSTKLVHFEKLHQTLGNYFHDIYSTTETTGKRTRQEKNGGTGGNQNSGRGNNGGRNKRNSTNTTTILPDLALRLAGYLQNPHAVTVQAARLLHAMREYSNRHAVSAVERRGQDYDYTRYWPAYEAAAFFVVATTSQNALHTTNSLGGGNAAAKSSSNNARRRKSNKKDKSAGTSSTAVGVLVAGDNDEDDGGQQQQQQITLRLESVSTACNQFTLLELKEKLPHVQEMAVQLAKQEQQEQKEQHTTKMDNRQQQQQQQLLSSKRPRLGLGTTTTITTATSNLKRNTGQRYHAAAAYKRGKGKNRHTGAISTSRLHKTTHGVEDMGHVHDDNNSSNTINEEDDDDLVRWKDCILSEAQARVQNICKEAESIEEGNEKDNGDNDDKSLKHENQRDRDDIEHWTATAADHVLQKYNLLLDVQE